MKSPQIPTPLTRSQAVQSQSPDQIQQEVRERAYKLYEQRGREDGHDLDDWLTAESEVTRTKTVAA
jgi:hypothetical protein